MLGHHWPGSEGNLASDLENQEPLDTGNQAQPPPKPEGAPAKAEGNKDAPPPREARTKGPRGEKPPADARPPADAKPADVKPPVEAQSVVSDQTNPAEPIEAPAQS